MLFFLPIWRHSAYRLILSCSVRYFREIQSVSGLTSRMSAFTLFVFLECLFFLCSVLFSLLYTLTQSYSFIFFLWDCICKHKGRCFDVARKYSEERKWGESACWRDEGLAWSLSLPFFFFLSLFFQRRVFLLCPLSSVMLLAWLSAGQCSRIVLFFVDFCILLLQIGTLRLRYVAAPTEARRPLWSRRRFPPLFD